MEYLVDSNVLSETTKSRPNEAVIGWLRRHFASIVATPIVLGEIECGLLLLQPGLRRSRLERWFAEVVSVIQSVEIDTVTASHWAGLVSRLQRQGRSMPVNDSLIAASALQHGLTIATRNSRDFQHCGVSIVDPFHAGAP
jgi:toxin FitB